VYTAYNIYSGGAKRWFEMQRKRWYVYMLLALIDVEANYFIVKAYSMTSMLSAMLLDCWSIPTVVFLSYWFLHARYRVIHYGGVLVCVVGVAVLVISDINLEQLAPSILLGDLLCVLGATLYGISNALEQSVAEKHALSEVLGQLGLYGSVISLAQLLLIERHEFYNLQWRPIDVAVLLGFNVCSFLLYSLAPVLFRMAGATFYNLSLLTSDVYGLIFGILLFKAHITVWYPFAYVWIISGILLFNAGQSYRDDGKRETKDEEAEGAEGEKIQGRTAK